jgi:hypothetical protein
MFPCSSPAGVDEEGGEKRTLVKRQGRKPLKELTIDDEGFAILPEDYMDASLPELKDMIRAFVTYSYRE